MKKETNKRFGKILYVGIANKYYSAYHHCYKVLEKLADEILIFDYREVNLQYGKEEMNKRFLELIEKEKPDFIFVYSIVDDFYINTLMRIREVSPNSLTMMFFGDDDSMYESYSRYYKLFFDYCIVYQKQCLYKYKEEGSKNTFVALGINLDNFKPLNLEKKYDVIFYGIPESDRYEYLKYLIDNGINIKIFGRGWHKYPEFENYYFGSLTSEELVKTINEAKINLCLSKNMFGHPHFKGRVFETAACKSFMLVEYFSEYRKIFEEGKEIVMFKDKEDLLSKINYYLKNEKEREEICRRIYKKVKKKYDFALEMEKLFGRLKERKIMHNPLPSLDKKMIELNKTDVNLNEKELKEKLNSYDYICFNDGILRKDPYKEYLQIYSLKTSKKDISCCDCYIGNSKLGDYLFYSGFYTRYKNKEDFKKTVSISQIAATKGYFLKNLVFFKSAFDNKKMDLLEEENTVLIGIPLLQIPYINYVKYKLMKGYIRPKFFYKLYSLKYQKKLFSDPYIYNIFFEIIKGNFFLLWLMISALNDKHYKNKMNELNGQIK